MRTMLRENYGEALVGLLVVIVAGWFVLFAWRNTGGGTAGGAIEVKALFPSASGVNVGTDVRIAGLKVGSVVAQRLDPETFQAEVTLALDPAVKVPSDSTAIISSEGLLGGSYIGMQPGGSDVPLKNGDAILDTQGSVDLMGLVGQFVNGTGGSSGGGAGADTGTGDATPAPAADGDEPIIP